MSKRRRASFLLVLVMVVALVVNGCTGATSVTSDGGSDNYSVDIAMDPPTLNPPQLGSLTFQVKESETGKIVNSFEPVAEALIHNVIIRKDLQFFRHDAAQHAVRDQVSVAAYFPSSGTFYTYTMYKPAGAEVQTFKSTIVSGEAGPEARLVEERTLSSRADKDLSIAKVTNGLTVAWVKGSTPIKAGEASQLLFHITEQGQPVTSLWPVYGAPGHVWLVDDKVENFTHLMASAESRVLVPSATPAQKTTPDQLSSSRPILTEIPTGSGTPLPVPTLVPPLKAALSTVTAVPYPTLLPVQQIPQGGVGTQDVLPAVGYGPDLVFTHNFPHEGLYKMWLEVRWRDQVVTTDFVVRVEQ
ncbi:MAG TPA: hypothetical protein VJ183_16725 [Chloroflexia bacterium]|nr:hypothetical protein [Chloroflexia bacterium]